MWYLCVHCPWGSSASLAAKVLAVLSQVLASATGTLPKGSSRAAMEAALAVLNKPAADAGQAAEAPAADPGALLAAATAALKHVLNRVKEDTS